MRTRREIWDAASCSRTLFGDTMLARRSLFTPFRVCMGGDQCQRRLLLANSSGLVALVSSQFECVELSECEAGGSAVLSQPFSLHEEWMQRELEVNGSRTQLPACPAAPLNPFRATMRRKTSSLSPVPVQRGVIRTESCLTFEKHKGHNTFVNDGELTWVSTGKPSEMKIFPVTHLIWPSEQNSHYFFSKMF